MLTMYNSKRDCEASDCTTAVLPVGAIEQHGSPLSVGTDTIFAGEYATRLAEKLDACLPPVIPVTSSIERPAPHNHVRIRTDAGFAAATIHGRIRAMSNLGISYQSRYTVFIGNSRMEGEPG